MIKLKKSSTIPVVVDRQGNSKLKSETISNNTLYDGNPQNYNTGAVNMSFDSEIYGHINIKTELINNQSGKCAFCEQHILSISYGDVEHFRPKGGYKQNSKDSLHKPGYYWLAYDWYNLLFCCQKCNQRYKKNYFPLRNIERRAKNHKDNIKKEKPFFINPYIENPIFFIGFNSEVASGKDKNHRGKNTINALNLNRKGDGVSDLYEIRKDIFDRTEATYKIANLQAPIPGLIDQDEIDKARALMSKFRSKSSQFSSMIIHNFPR